MSHAHFPPHPTGPTGPFNSQFISPPTALTADQGTVSHQRVRFFSVKAFEHLLFELHPSVYREIESQLQALERRYPGSLAGLCTIFDLNFANPTSQGAIVPDSARVHGRPAFDVQVAIDESEMHKVRKCSRVDVKMTVQPADLGDQRSNSNHLIVGLKADKVQQSFIVPLPLVLQSFEDRVCKPGTYQVYEHTLIRKRAQQATSMTEYLAGAGQYVGITSRTWQQRCQEHIYAARRGSYLLFHRALRGELMDVFAHEHIVLRAGLNRRDALHIEEVEVEQRTLHERHSTGLNMIPGGEAGLQFLSTMTKRPAASIKVDDIDELIEMEINRNLRQPGLNIKGCHTNAKLARLWEIDIGFRIRAMTNQANRLSYRQIRNARLWHACGWSTDKIVENLMGMDGRVVTHEQVQRLLDGKSYATIPHVLIPIQPDPPLDA